MISDNTSVKMHGYINVNSRNIRFAYYFEDDLLKEVTLNDLYEFMTYINNFKSSNDSYKARKVSSLRSFYNYLSTKINFIDTNPAINLDTPKSFLDFFQLLERQR